MIISNERLNHTELTDIISKKRLDTYNDISEYVWNSKLSENFFFILQNLEVGLRNSIYNAYKKSYPKKSLFYLYENNIKNDVYFAYDEVEKDKFIEQLGKEKFTIQRSKGLGENEPDMMNLTTMNPESRRLIKVLPADAEQTAEIFDVLLGDNLQGRKDYIVEHGNEYIDQLDVS